MKEEIKKFIKRTPALYYFVKLYMNIMEKKNCLINRMKAFWRYGVLPFWRKVTGRKYTAELQKFKGIHKGKRAFIIASGPSLREEDILKLRNEITFAVNTTITLCPKLGWMPTYYCISDPKVYEKMCTLLNALKLKDVFMGMVLKKYEDTMEYVPHWYDEYCHGVPYMDKSETVMKKGEFSDDIYKKGVCTIRSITYCTLQIAAYMGFDEIYLYGVDNNYLQKRAHFNDEDENQNLSKVLEDEFKKFCVDDMISYKIAKEYAEKNDIKIYNATRGGCLEVFERVKLEDVV